MKKSTMSSENPIFWSAYPFVSQAIVPWPTNYPSSTEETVATASNGFVILKPTDDPIDVLYNNRCVYLVPGAVYTWKNILIQKEVIINGQGATIKLVGNDGPIINISNGSQVGDVHVTIRDVKFVGSDIPPVRTEEMKEDFVTSSAIWITNAWKTTIENCDFTNFNGAALFFSDSTTYTTSQNWQQQQIVSGCRFLSCRICIANSGGSEYSLVNNCCFFDCQICFHVSGGNWRRVGNQIANCRCAYFHNQTNMWYSGPNGIFNPAHGAFTGNTMNHCDYGGNLWPSNFTLTNGTVVSLAGMFHNNSTYMPPTWTGNTQYYGDMKILNFPTNAIWVISGCNIFGYSGSAPNSGMLVVSTAVRDRVYITGCSSSTTNLALINVNQNNVFPLFGTFKTATVSATGVVTGITPVVREISNDVRTRSKDETAAKKQKKDNL